MLARPHKKNRLVTSTKGTRYGLVGSEDWDAGEEGGMWGIAIKLDCTVEVNVAAIYVHQLPGSVAGLF